MPRDLFEATIKGWARLNPQQRERFFLAGLKAALRLERREFREWLRRRVSEPPLAAPVDPASFAISKADIALLMRSTREQPRSPPPQRNLAVPPQTHPLRGPQFLSVRDWNWPRSF